MRVRRQPGGPRWIRRLRRAIGRGAAALRWNAGAPLRALRAARQRSRLRRSAKSDGRRRGVIGPLVSMGAGLGHALGGAGKFLWHRVTQGDIRYLVQGLPAVLIGALIGTIAGAAVLSSDVPLKGRYKRAAGRAMAAEDYRAAELYYERLAQLDGSTAETRYALALTAEAMNQLDRARAIMVKLAPRDGTGYGPAHLWLARYLVDAARGDPERLQAARPHVTRFLADQPNSPLAHAVAARLFAGLGQLNVAEEHLTRAIDLDPSDAAKMDLRLSLARVYVLENKHALARPEAEAALNYLRRRAEVEPSNHKVRLSWAEAALFLELFDEAERVLQDGIAMDLSENPRLLADYHNRLSQLYITKASVLARQGKAGLAEQLDLLNKALQQNPKNQAALAGVVNISKQRGEVADEARSSLKDALAKGVTPATAHFILGNIAWDRGEADVARRELEAAYQLDPTLPHVGNNLAWYIAESAAPDLSRALNIINGVIETAPDNPAFRETRGQILVKQGRWSDARADLEFALPAMRNDAALHRTLATVYRNLGDSEMATRHEELAAQHAPPQ